MLRRTVLLLPGPIPCSKYHAHRNSVLLNGLETWAGAATSSMLGVTAKASRPAWDRFRSVQPERWYAVEELGHPTRQSMSCGCEPSRPHYNGTLGDPRKSYRPSLELLLFATRIQVRELATSQNDHVNAKTTMMVNPATDCRWIEFK
jgi:hypothetical protein